MSVIAISIGGSILIPNEPDTKFVRKLSALLLEKSRDHTLLLVVGGGGLARKYIEACRKLGVDETFLDEVGIRATRLNASVLLAALRSGAYPKIAETLDEAITASHRHSIVVLGGTHPGHTTDAVTVFVAEKARADRILITTNVDGVYTSDPKKDPRAKFLHYLTPSMLVDIAGEMHHEAGSKGVIDPIGAKLIARSNIETLILNGRSLSNLDKAIDGKEFHGSRVVLELPNNEKVRIDTVVISLMALKKQLMNKRDIIRNQLHHVDSAELKNQLAHKLRSLNKKLHQFDHNIELSRNDYDKLVRMLNQTDND